MIHSKHGLTLFIISLFCITSAWSTPSDRQKKITGTQKTATIDANSGKTVLIGNVIIRQGALIIYADKVSLETDKVTNELVYMLAEGQPVRFIDTPVENGYPVEAKGLQIEFLPLKNTIITTGQAQITQQGNQANGERIEYNTVTGLMTIESKRAITGNNDDNQAELIIQPGVLN